MASISSPLTGSGINTDRISVASKQRSSEAPVMKEEAQTLSASSFRREVPIQQKGDFVEVNGKRYFLNARRGTYVNILV